MDAIFGMLAKPSTSIPLGIIIVVALVIAIERLLTVSAPFHQKWSDSTRLQNLKHATEILNNLEGNQPAKNAIHAYILKQSLVLQESSKSLEPTRLREARATDIAMLSGIGLGAILSTAVLSDYFTSAEFTEMNEGASDLEVAFAYLFSSLFLGVMITAACIGAMGMLVMVTAYIVRYVRRRLVYLVRILTNKDHPEYMI